MDQENIHYIKHHLHSASGMIAHYENITVIIIDDNKVKTKTSENTILMQELGHYMAGAYYHTNSPFELIEEIEHKADKKAWAEFFPYEEIKKLMKRGLTTATEIAKYYDVEVPYMAKCLNYYYKHYGFN